MESVSVVIPAYNEEASIQRVVSEIRECLSSAGIEHEVVVVADGVTDGTVPAAKAVADQVVVHPLNMGYGRSLKSGILAARHDLIAIIDADGTYPVSRLPDLIRDAERCDMVVGARTGSVYHGGLIKRIGRWIFRRLAEFSAGQQITDINSGMRVFRRSQMIRFFPVISAGFSFTTTSTLAYVHNDLLIMYVPIAYNRREGRSHVRYLRDSLRALQIIVEAILRFNPVKIFLLLATPYVVLAIMFGVAGAVARDGLLLAGGVVSLCTAGLILAAGFLAVALAARGRPIDPADLLTRIRTSEDQRHDPRRSCEGAAADGR